MRKSLVYSALVLAAVLIGWQVWHLARSPALAHCAVDDFVEYWTAGRLNMAGEDSYDQYGMMDLQRQLRPDCKFPVMMWNPPWTFAVVLPVAMLPYPLGRILWCLGAIAAVVLSAGGLWSLYGGPARRWWLAIVAAFVFAPTLFAIGMGQLSPLVLAGIVGFAVCAARGWLVLAGMAAAATLVKPHLVYLFWAALALWSWDRRQPRVLLAAAVALAAMLVWPLANNPQVLGQYHQAMSFRPAESWSAPTPDSWVAPTVGVLLRLVFAWGATWLQMLPSLAGLIWLGWHWRRHRHDWSWPEQLPLLLLVSVATSAYGWMFDQIVLLVPLLAMLAAASRDVSRRLLWSLGAWMAVTVLAYALWPLPLLSGPPSSEPAAGLLARVLSEPNMFWNIALAPLLLIAYLIARRDTHDAGRLADPIVSGEKCVARGSSIGMAE